MSSLFGSPSKSTNNSTSQSTSNSSNQAYPMLSSALGGQLGNAGAASNQLSGMLGLNGNAGQNQAFQNFQNSTGYQFGLNQGEQAVTGNAATRGLLNSGSTAKALDTYGQNYANTQYQNYTNLLSGLTNTGNQAGSIIGGAGNLSNSNSASNATGNSTGDSSKEAENKLGFVGSLL